jgi:hypothetical protein
LQHSGGQVSVEAFASVLGPASFNENIDTPAVNASAEAAKMIFFLIFFFFN